jgi:hypothetical protein
VGKKSLNSWTAPLAAGLASLCISAIEAQTFFGTMGVENAIGVERGSTALVEPVDKSTTILTLDSYGSEEVGPWVTSLTFAIPRVLGATDQWDLTGVVGGPGEERSTELRAGGFGYRSGPGTTTGRSTSAPPTRTFGPTATSPEIWRSKATSGESLSACAGIS